MMWKRMKELKKDQRGLTLIELLAVVVILGIIMAIAIPAIGGIIEKQKAKANQANALMILDAAKIYFVDHPEVAASATPAVTLATLNTDRYLEQIPNNPFSNAVYTTGTVHYNNGDLQIDLDTGKADDSKIGLVKYDGFTRADVLAGKKATASTP